MKRFLLVVAGLLLMLLAGPPLWYGIFPPDPPPPLEPPGRRVLLPDGVGLNVIDEGDGPAIVLVHGLPGMGSDWRYLTDALVARGQRVIAVDRAGYGHSDARENASPVTNTEDMLALLEATGVEDATFVGWSYGGVVGMMVAEQAPDAIGRLVLVGTGGPDSADAQPPEAPGFMRFLYSDPVLVWRASVPPIGWGLMQAASTRAFSGGEMPDWWIDGLKANFARQNTLLTYRSEMFTFDGELKPEAIGVPTLILHGDDDLLAPVAIGRYLDTVIPDSRLIETPGGSHMIPVTHAEELADAIVAFQVETSAPPPATDEAMEEMAPGETGNSEGAGAPAY
jgi:non-heme chloroperoxidase